MPLYSAASSLQTLFMQRCKLNENFTGWKIRNSVESWRARDTQRSIIKRHTHKSKNAYMFAQIKHAKISQDLQRTACSPRTVNCVLPRRCILPAPLSPPHNIRIQQPETRYDKTTSPDTIDSFHLPHKKTMFSKMTVCCRHAPHATFTTF